MPSFNKVMILGNLTRDPQLKHVTGGRDGQLAIAEFGIAMNRKYRTAAGEDRDEVCFVDCSAFGRQAETITQWCKKGKALFVEGRLKFDSWEGQDGGKRSRLTVVVENFQFIGSKDDGQAGGGPDRGDAAQGWVPGEGRDRPAAAAPSRGASPQAQRPASGGGGRPPPSKAPAPAAADAGPPFGDEQQFREDEIPFAWSGRVSTQNL
jgi:single-strand DNA-binding protein